MVQTVRATPALAAATLVLVVLSGCLGAGPAPAGGTGDVPANGTDGPAIDDHPGDRPHVHDRWGGRSQAAVFDGTVRIQKHNELSPENGLESYLICELSCDYYGSFIPSTGDVVPPGADRVVVQAEWSPDRRVRLAYQAANEHRFTELDRKASGTAWTINTTVQMADDGHARLSLWRFRLYSCQDCLVVPVPSDPFEFDVEVTVTAYRAAGPLPLEPPHPDWWANGTTRTVHEGSDEVHRAGADKHWVRPGAPPGFALGGSWLRYLDREDHGNVAPGSRLLVVRFNWTNDAPGGKDLRPVPWFEWDNTDFDWHRVEPRSASEGAVLFTVPITADMVDGMYANKSRWRFRFGFTGEDTGAEDPVFGGSLTGFYLIDGSWDVVITVHRGSELPASEG